MSLKSRLNELEMIDTELDSIEKFIYDLDKSQDIDYKDKILICEDIQLKVEKLMENYYES